ncbi:C39 family peptidase [Emcibacter sp. SYSU 3D8]|uniref:C39 family peptidase n=1 Tax=Emcibacter sp. SYSU 3D8 TaxID=3133969 RepID=UPI0031FEB3A8
MHDFLKRLAGIVLVAAFAIAGTIPSAAATGTRSLKEMREAGVVIQKWDTSCGAAAIATVLTYHFNDPVSEQEVAGGLLRQTEPLKVRHRGGFSMLDMKRYVEERGYRAIGFKGMTIEDIRHFDGPIVPIKVHGYNHYVVFAGLTPKGRVRLADPAYGNRTLSRDKFEEAWMGGMAFVMRRGDP